MPRLLARAPARLSVVAVFVGLALLAGRTAHAQSVGWALLQIPPDAPRSMVFDAARGVTVHFGGHNATSSGETWAWDGAAWSQRAVGGPSARAGYARSE